MNEAEASLIPAPHLLGGPALARSAWKKMHRHAVGLKRPSHSLSFAGGIASSPEEDRALRLMALMFARPDVLDGR
jgi:hypothetical protein